VKLQESSFVSKQRKAPVPTASLGFLLYNYHYYIVDCAVMLQEFIETLECITTLSISPLILPWWKSVSSAMLH
jgi:hypothetical protein